MEKTIIALKKLGIAKEWHKDEMHRLYVNLPKAYDMYYNKEGTKSGNLPLNRYQRLNGQLWIDLKTSAWCSKNIRDKDELISCIEELIPAPAEEPEPAAEFADVLVGFLHRREEAAVMIHNAAAKIGSGSDTVEALYNAVKRQAEDLDAYCQTERNRLAAMIRKHGGKTGEQPKLPFAQDLCGTAEWYTLHGQSYLIRSKPNGDVELIREGRQDGR